MTYSYRAILELVCTDGSLRCQCFNCDKAFSAAHLNELMHVTLEPGDDVPAGLCPDCGHNCFLVPEPIQADPPRGQDAGPDLLGGPEAHDDPLVIIWQVVPHQSAHSGVVAYTTQGMLLVRRSLPGADTFAAWVDGKAIGNWPDIQDAIQQAETAANTLHADSFRALVLASDQGFHAGLTGNVSNVENPYLEQRERTDDLYEAWDVGWHQGSAVFSASARNP